MNTALLQDEAPEVAKTTNALLGEPLLEGRIPATRPVPVLDEEQPGGLERSTDPDRTPVPEIVDDPELGATTAEYGIVMLAAVGFAGLLVVILKSGEVKDLLMNIIRTALSTG